MWNKTSHLLIIVFSLTLLGCQTAQNDHLAIYLFSKDIPAVELSHTDLGQFVLESEPLVSDHDIVSYDKISHSIELTRAAFNRVQGVFTLPVKVNGMPFVVCVGEERIYAGAFWTPLSSLSYDGVVIMQPFDPEKTMIQIALGYPVPSVFTGNDPRADLRIIKALEQDGKLK
jgi:hypothetical protein